MNNRTMIVLVGMMFVASVLVLGFVLVRSMRPTPLAIPNSLIYPLARTSYKWGDTLVYTSTITIIQAGVPKTVRGWRYGASQGFAVGRDCTGTIMPSTIRNDLPAFPAESVGTKVTTVLTETIPRMPGGAYVYTTSVSGVGGEIVYSVPVIVEGVCP